MRLADRDRAYVLHPCSHGRQLVTCGGKMTLTLKSSAFDNGSEIPSRYTCEGEDLSPPLVWTGVPEAAKRLVLIIDDPDAPDPKAPRTIWVHWVLYNIAGCSRSAGGH